MDFTKLDIATLRIVNLIKRHIRDEDQRLTDKELILRVFGRYKRSLDEPVEE